MSIKYNNKTIAGYYKTEIIPNADTVNAGKIRIATQAEVDSGESNSTAVTPSYLSKKQDKLTAGRNITIENGVISADTTTSINVDGETISNENAVLSSIGTKTKSNTIKIDWEGTKAEYEAGLADGTISNDWYCYITDDETVVDFVEYPELEVQNMYKTGNVSTDTTGYNQLVEMKSSGNKTGTDTVKIGGETVEIPYILSKTGSKIVDVAYRDKVQALYNQEGKANYYTIDETNQNFTLPMGEIYGMINSIKPSSGVDLCTILCMPFGVDESGNKYRYLNGQILVQSQYSAFTAKVKSWQSTRTSLFTTETEWQAIKTASKLGQCGKFVIDDEAGTIRLPAIVNINGLTDLSKCGLIKDESLPAHTHTRGTMDIRGTFASKTGGIYETSGAFYTSGTVRGQINGGYNGDLEKGAFSAARTWTGSTSTPDNATYQDNAPVQQEAVQYPYVICVNTGVEEAERPINNYQVNNTNSYGDNKYVGDTTLNNASWLKSTGQANSGTVYTGFYNWAVANIGQPFGAGLIKESSATDITDYDLVIDQANQTFILPTLNGSEDLPSDKFDNLTLGASEQNYTAPANGLVYINKQCGKTGEYCSIGCMTGADDVWKYGIQTVGQGTQYIELLLPVKKGDVYRINYTLTGTTHKFRFIYAKGNGNLYYYVGDTLQNADLINIARMQEQKADKTELDGKWTKNSKIIADNITMTQKYDKTFDLSSILPNDGEVYDVIVVASGRTGNTAGNTLEIVADTSITKGIILCRGVTRTNSNVAFAGCCVLPVGADRSIRFWAGNATNANSLDKGCSFYIKSFRRTK